MMIDLSSKLLLHLWLDDNAWEIGVSRDKIFLQIEKFRLI